MDIVFRKIIGKESPAAGELWIRPRREADQGTCGLALLVLDQGTDALEQGPGPWTRIVVSATGTSPNLDEMLATSIAVQLLEASKGEGEKGRRGDRETGRQGDKEKESLQSPCLPFSPSPLLPPVSPCPPLPFSPSPLLLPVARYAEIARKGLRPSDLPPEKSLEGMFLAVLNFHGDNLADPQTASRFLTSWQKMFDRLVDAAKKKEDPFTTPLFETCHDLAQERAYLAADQEVYRQDVLRGERWRIKLPDGPDESSGLILRQPRSLLFKYWARRDPHAPAGSAYLLLGVEWAKGEWVFSTDPVMRLSLKSLAEVLDPAEAVVDPHRDPGNPWYDGKGHQHTLVASPKGGSQLGEKSILRIVRTWASAKPVGGKRTTALAMSSFAAGALIVAAALILAKGIFPSTHGQVIPKSDTHIVATNEERPHGLVLKEVIVDGVARPRSVEVETAPLAVVPYFADRAELKANGKVSFPLENDVARPVKLRIKLTFSQPTPEPIDVTWKMELDGQTKYSNKVIGVKNGTIDSTGDLQIRVPAKPCSFTFSLTSQADAAVRAEVNVECLPDNSESRLHILAIGVSDYAIKRKSLHWAHKDAEEIVKSLQNQNKARPVFKDVIVHRNPWKGQPVKGLLTNADATQAAILHELAGLRESVKEDDLALIFFSGHGQQQERSHHYFFLPFDYDSAKELDASSVSWDAMRRYVVDMPCPTVIILDTCHSGAAGLGTRGSTSTKTELKRAVEEALVHFAKAKRGIGILAACLGDQQAIEENDRWKHGVLTLAILECVTGKRIAAAGPNSPPLPNEKTRAGVISLNDLYKYSEVRVAELIQELGYEQAVDLRRFQDLDPRQIPLAAFQKED